MTIVLLDRGRYETMRAEGHDAPRVMMTLGLTVSDETISSSFRGRLSFPGLPPILREIRFGVRDTWQNMLPSALRDLATWIRDNFHRRFGIESFVQLDGRPVLPVLYLGNFKPFSVRIAPLLACCGGSRMQLMTAQQDVSFNQLGSGTCMCM